MPSIYILLTRTNSTLSRVIASHTKEDYVHASIILNNHVEHGYSFSRRKMTNPLIGGFVKEDYPEWVTYFKDVQCCIYELEVTDKQYQKVDEIIKSFDAEKKKYKYHFLGVVAQSLKIDYERKNRFFCTQFVSHVLMEAGALDLDKPPIHVRSDDFRNHQQLKQVYEGSLEMVLYKVIDELPESQSELDEEVS